MWFFARFHFYGNGVNQELTWLRKMIFYAVGG
jgi:hypothetical protein